MLSKYVEELKQLRAKDEAGVKRPAEAAMVAAGVNAEERTWTERALVSGDVLNMFLRQAKQELEAVVILQVADCKAQIKGLRDANEFLERELLALREYVHSVQRKEARENRLLVTVRVQNDDG